MDELPLETMRVVQTVVCMLARGNLFDEIWVEGKPFVPSGRYREILRLLEEEAARLGLTEASVLDVGCWQGTLLWLLEKRGYRVSGMDLCGPALQTARERLGASDPCLREGWAHEVLPSMFPRDLVTCQEVLEHIPSSILPQTCDAILEVTRYAAFLEVPGWDDGSCNHLRVFSIADFERLFARPGWHLEVLQGPGTGVYTTVKLVRL